MHACRFASVLNFLLLSLQSNLLPHFSREVALLLARVCVSQRATRLAATPAVARSSPATWVRCGQTTARHGRSRWRRRAARCGGTTRLPLRQLMALLPPPPLPRFVSLLSLHRFAVSSFSSSCRLNLSHSHVVSIFLILMSSQSFSFSCRLNLSHAHVVAPSAFFHSSAHSFALPSLHPKLPS